MKEVGWMIDKEAGTVALPERKLRQLPQLLTVTATQRRILRKELERLKGKLCSMHLSVPGAVAQLYHIYRVLAQGGDDRF